MTLLWWLDTLLAVGVLYAAAHLWSTHLNLVAVIRSRENGIYLHTAVGDRRAAVRDLVIAFALLMTFAVAPSIPARAEVRTFFAGVAFLVVVVAFVLGMAFARLHERTRPSHRQNEIALAVQRGEDRNKH